MTANVAVGAGPNHVLAGLGEVRFIKVAVRVVAEDFTLAFQHGWARQDESAMFLIRRILRVCISATSVATELGRPVDERIDWCDG